MFMKSGSPSEMKKMHGMIGRGPVTIMLVFSKTCPHCVTYMPIWKKLCATQGRKANMVSMESQIYQKTPYAEKKTVSGVPTVLYVNKAGEITEARAPRDTTVMTNAVRVTPESDLPASVVSDPMVNTVRLNTGSRANASNASSRANASNASSRANALPSANASPKVNTKPLTANSNLFKVTEFQRRTSSEPTPVANAVISGTMSSENPLPPVPGTVVQVQQGGNPWSAFLIAAAQQAAPAAVLLGAYAALPKRSSGLPAPRKTRKAKFDRS
jgi:hypothetical protein